MYGSRHSLAIGDELLDVESVYSACSVREKKIGFINGAIPESTRERERSIWRRTDEMVSTWIINSILKEISKTFIYSSSSRKLWIDVEEQFGESNGPQI